MVCVVILIPSSSLVYDSFWLSAFSLRQSIMSSSLCDPVLRLPSVINMVDSKLSASMQLRHPLLAARLSSQTSHLSRDMRTLISPSVTVVHSHSSHLILCVGAPVSVTSTVATLYVQTNQCRVPVTLIYQSVPLPFSHQFQGCVSPRHP